MTIRSAKQREALADRYGENAAWATLHTGDPGSNGAFEISGGSPAYARQPVTWLAGDLDGVIVSEELAFDIPAETTFTHVGVWDSEGAFLDAGEATATFSSQGVFKLILTYTQN